MAKQHTQGRRSSDLTKASNLAAAQKIIAYQYTDYNVASAKIKGINRKGNYFRK